MAKPLKRKHMRLLLKEVNTSTRTAAVLIRCRHFPDNRFGLMTIETMLKHRTIYRCQPERITETVEAMEMKGNGHGH